MKIDKIAAGYERKFNLGDYNSLSLEVTIWADVEDGDDPQAVIQAVQDKCRDSVKAEYARLKSKVPANTSVEAKAQIAN
jgi:hypothetical protein